MVCLILSLNSNGMLHLPFICLNSIKTGMKMEYKVIGQSKTYYGKLILLSNVELDSQTSVMPNVFISQTRRWRGRWVTGNASRGEGPRLERSIQEWYVVFVTLLIILFPHKTLHYLSLCSKVSRQISVIPLECPNASVASFWWDENTNGKLVMRKFSMIDQADWSDNIEMDAAGTAGQLNCKHVVLNTAIDSLAGAYHRSSLVTISPRYVVKNTLHISITMIALSGGQQDVINKATQLRDKPTARDKKEELILKPGDSTFLYTFHDVSFEGIDSPRRWVVFCVNAAHSQIVGSRERPHKWHIVPIDRMDRFYYGEHDGLDTMSGIIEAKVSSAGGSNMIVIAHSANPPYRIENRSSSHFIQFLQDDDDATVFELPPMHSCGYTWCVASSCKYLF